jgi:hypothetical protein
LAKYRLFGVGQKGKSPVISSQHRINCYIEKIDDEDTEQTAIIASPGMDLFTDFGDTPCRARIEVGTLLYTVHRGTFYEVNNAGTKTSRGTLNTTTGRVDISYDGDDVLLITDGTNGYTYTISTTTLAVVGAAGFPDTAPTNDFSDIYFAAFGPADTFQISEDGTTWDALDISNGNVGTIVRGIADHGELVIFGSKKTTFWSNTGGSDFPYQPIRGADIEVGLAARWSLTKFDDSLAFLGKNYLGQVQVYRLQGHTPVVISNPEFESIINRYADVADATGYASLFEGHPFYRLNFPSQGKSWEFDGRSGVWTERQSGLSGERHRGEMALDYLNKVRVFDYENGKIYTVSATTYTENGTSYPFEVTSKRVVRDYDPFSLNKLYLDFETGVGLESGQGSDPKVMLRVSRDGGRTWGNEELKMLGKVGEYLTRVEWQQFGSSDSFVFKLRITDPVKRHLVNAALFE